VRLEMLLGYGKAALEQLTLLVSFHECPALSTHHDFLPLRDGSLWEQGRKIVGLPFKLLLEFLNYLHQDILESVIRIRGLFGPADGRVICNTLTELGHQKNGVVSSQVAAGYVVKLSPVSHLLVKHGFSSAYPEIVSRCINSTGVAVVVVDSSGNSSHFG